MLPKLILRQLIVFTFVVQLVLVVVASEPQQQQSSTLYTCNSKECVDWTSRGKTLIRYYGKTNKHLSFKPNEEIYIVGKPVDPGVTEWVAKIGNKIGLVPKDLIREDKVIKSTEKFQVDLQDILGVPQQEKRVVVDVEDDEAESNEDSQEADIEIEDVGESFSEDTSNEDHVIPDEIPPYLADLLKPTSVKQEEETVDHLTLSATTVLENLQSDTVNLDRFTQSTESSISSEESFSKNNETEASSLGIEPSSDSIFSSINFPPFTDSIVQSSSTIDQFSEAPQTETVEQFSMPATFKNADTVNPEVQSTDDEFDLPPPPERPLRLDILPTPGGQEEDFEESPRELKEDKKEEVEKSQVPIEFQSEKKTEVEESPLELKEDTKIKAEETSSENAESTSSDSSVDTTVDAIDNADIQPPNVDVSPEKLLEVLSANAVETEPEQLPTVDKVDETSVPAEETVVPEKTSEALEPQTQQQDNIPLSLESTSESPPSMLDYFSNVGEKVQESPPEKVELPEQLENVDVQQPVTENVIFDEEPVANTEVPAPIVVATQDQVTPAPFVEASPEEVTPAPVVEAAKEEVTSAPHIEAIQDQVIPALVVETTQDQVTPAPVESVVDEGVSADEPVVPVITEDVIEPQEQSHEESVQDQDPQTESSQHDDHHDHDHHHHHHHSHHSHNFFKESNDTSSIVLVIKHLSSTLLSFLPEHLQDTILDVDDALVFTGIIALTLVSICVPYFLIEGYMSVRPLKKKVTELNKSLWKVSAAYETQQEEFEIFKHKAMAHDEFKKRAEQFENDVVILKKLETKQREQITTLKTKLKMHEKEAVSIRSLIEKALADKNSVVDECDKYKAAYESTKEALVKTREELANYQAHTKSTSLQLGMSSKHAEMLTSKIAMLSQETEDMKSQLVSESEKRKLIEQAKQEVEQSKMGVEKELNEIKSICRQYEETVGSLNDEISKLESELASIKESLGEDSPLLEVAEIQAKAAFSEKETESLRTRLEGLQADNDNLSKKLKATTSTLEEIRGESEQTNNRLQVLESYFKEREEEYLKTIEELQLRENVRDKGKEELIKIIEEKENVCKDLSERLEALKDEFEETKQQHRNEIRGQEAKSHENWLSLCQAERKAQDARKEAEMLRQRLTALSKEKDDEDGDGLNGDVSFPVIPHEMVPLPIEEPPSYFGLGDFVPPPPLPEGEDVHRPPPLGGRLSPAFYDLDDNVILSPIGIGRREDDITTDGSSGSDSPSHHDHRDSPPLRGGWVNVHQQDRSGRDSMQRLSRATSSPIQPGANL